MKPSLQGLWENNPALVQLLGLCPLLAVSSHAWTALILGLCTVIVLVFANSLISLLRRWIDAALRLPIFMLTIATFGDFA